MRGMSEVVWNAKYLKLLPIQITIYFPFVLLSRLRTNVLGTRREIGGRNPRVMADSSRCRITHRGIGHNSKPFSEIFSLNI